MRAAAARIKGNVGNCQMKMYFMSVFTEVKWLSGIFSYIHMCLLDSVDP